jgi:hypothetical protein
MHRDARSERWHPRAGVLAVQLRQRPLDRERRADSTLCVMVLREIARLGEFHPVFREL